MRADAAICLSSIGPAAEEATPALLQNLEDPKTQLKALTALRSISKKPDLVVSVLIGFLSSTNPSQQCWALSSLSDLEAAARTAVPKVLELLDAARPDIRQAATNALKQIDPEAAARAGVK
jgi:HEAT repeat protein